MSLKQIPEVGIYNETESKSQIDNIFNDAMKNGLPKKIKKY